MRYVALMFLGLTAAWAGERCDSGTDEFTANRLLLHCPRERRPIRSAGGTRSAPESLFEAQFPACRCLYIRFTRPLSAPSARPRSLHDVGKGRTSASGRGQGAAPQMVSGRHDARSAFGAMVTAHLASAYRQIPAPRRTANGSGISKTLPIRHESDTTEVPLDIM